MLFPLIFKNYETQKNSSDKNMKFSAKCVHCTYGLSELFIYVYVKFTCLCTYFVKSSSSYMFEVYIVLYDSVPHE